jgi:hypothetical protein
MSLLDSHLQQIAASIAHLKSSPSAIARDLLLDELRKCYDAALSMEVAAADVAPVVETPVTPAPIEVAVTPQTLVEKPAAGPAASQEEAAIEPEGPQHTVREIIAETKLQEQTSAKVPETPIVETVSAELPASRPLLGKPDAKPNNESILAGKLNRKPITDLSSGIPLNEKFGIIRNLFSGNASDFGDAVLKLNNSKSAAELKHYFQLLTQRRDWDMESESYQIFLGYVERKAGSLQPSEADSDH